MTSYFITLHSMRGLISIPVKDTKRLGDQICRLIQMETYGIVLRSNDYSYNSTYQNSLRRYNLVAALGALEIISPQNDHFQKLREVISCNDWLFGYLGYDLKNGIEKLQSANTDILGFPDLFFIRPEIVLTVEGDILNIHYHKSKHTSQTAGSFYDRIMAAPKVSSKHDSTIEFSGRFSRDEYINTINQVLRHIHRGDIYEMNLCQEFYATQCNINPYETYIKLNSISPTPFSAFGKFGDKFVMCASPERYLKKNGEVIISQPIKGTTPRGKTPEEDLALRDQLYNDKKERSENIMIVDLVRNDLSRMAQKGSVKVEELCGIYPFQQVNQMISTVSCKLRSENDIIDIIIATFPMGSMTGAPKIRAMELIEEFEKSKRGLFSGSIGYISPSGDFDFNVIIRTLLYNRSKKYLSYTVGGAITSLSNPESEYEECLLKASAIRQTLN